LGIRESVPRHEPVTLGEVMIQTRREKIFFGLATEQVHKQGRAVARHRINRRQRPDVQLGSHGRVDCDRPPGDDASPRVQVWHGPNDRLSHLFAKSFVAAEEKGSILDDGAAEGEAEAPKACASPGIAYRVRQAASGLHGLCLRNAPAWRQLAKRRMAALGPGQRRGDGRPSAMIGPSRPLSTRGCGRGRARLLH